MRSAIIHDWLISPSGGAERCLQAIHELYPSAIYTLLQSKERLRGTYFEGKEILSSFIQKLPFCEKGYRSYLPLFPLAIEQIDLSAYDLILSSSHCAAKGALVHSEQLHICYCHTPMRYAWDLTELYLKRGGVKNAMARFFLHYLRMWDFQSASRVDHFIANSEFIAKRIKKNYRRDSCVIYPPVDVDFFELEEKKEDYYVAASRLVPYKRIDLLVEAFSLMPDLRLVVAGEGPEEKNLRKKAGKNIEFLGFQEDVSLKRLLQKAKGFVFAAVEDFGILPVEAMASGTPVIALREGGVKETVKEGLSGSFFEEASVRAICEAVRRFEKQEFDPKIVRVQAERFSKERFQREFRGFVESRYEAFKTCAL